MCAASSSRCCQIISIHALIVGSLLIGRGTWHALSTASSKQTLIAFMPSLLLTEWWDLRARTPRNAMSRS